MNKKHFREEVFFAMSAAASKERLRLLMLAKKKDKKPKRAPSAPVAAEAEAVAKRARVEQLEEEAVVQEKETVGLSEPMVPVQVDEGGFVNVEAELSRVFAVRAGAEREEEQEEGEEDKRDEGGEDEVARPLENDLTSIMRQRIAAQAQARREREKREEEEEDEAADAQGADVFANLGNSWRY